MDDFISILSDFQPAGVIIVALLLVAVVSSATIPKVGPILSFVGLAAVTGYVGNEVLSADPRPSWLLPLAGVGLLASVGAGYRLWSAARARSVNDLTVGYVFPTMLAVIALWLSVALIEFEKAVPVTALTP